MGRSAEGPISHALCGKACPERSRTVGITASRQMLYKTLRAAVYGIDANIIQFEVDCSGIQCDQDHFHTVGLPDAAVRESRDRVRAALKNCGCDIPPRTSPSTSPRLPDGSWLALPGSRATFCRIAAWIGSP